LEAIVGEKEKGRRVGVGESERIEVRKRFETKREI